MLHQTIDHAADQGELAHIRSLSARAILIAIWLHGPVIGVVGWCVGGNAVSVVLLWLAAAIAATIAHRAQPGMAGSRATIAAALCVMPALIVMALAGSSWQADGHMLFFAELAVTAALLDMQAVLVGALAIALHHLALNFILPALVFPGGEDFSRVIFHAVVLVLECAALAWLVDQAARSLSKAEHSAVQIGELHRLRAEEQERALAEAAAATRAARNRTADSFEAKIGAMVSALSSEATQLQITAQSMAETATHTNEEAASVAAAARDAGAGVQTVAAATEELTASIHEISRQVARSADITGKAVEDARRTDAVVRTLSESARKIGDVVQLITGIAEQTNLLALNATIEAARAGDAGKGFAVVASEVKSLATQTAVATKAIGAQITQIQGATGEAVDAIMAIGATIDEVNGIASAIAAAVEEQGAATANIAHHVQQAAANTRAVNATIMRVSQAAHETGAASGQVLGAANGLSDQADQLTKEVGTFVAGVRAA